MVCVINQNRFRRVFGTAPDGPFAKFGDTAAGGTEWSSGLPFPAAVCHRRTLATCSFVRRSASPPHLGKALKLASEFHADAG